MFLRVVETRHRPRGAIAIAATLPPPNRQQQNNKTPPQDVILYDVIIVVYDVISSAPGVSLRFIICFYLHVVRVSNMNVPKSKTLLQRGSIIHDVRFVSRFVFV